MEAIWRCFLRIGMFLTCGLLIGCGIISNLFRGEEQQGVVLENAAFRGNVLYYNHDREPIPVGRARVMIEVGGDIFEETFTDNEGVFNFDSLPDGEFNLQIAHKDFKTFDLKEKNGITLNPLRILNTSLSVEMDFMSTVLRGRVIIDMSSAVIKMPDGTILKEGEGAFKGDIPVREARILTYPSTAETQTDSAGRFTIESNRFEPGVDFVVHAHHSAFYSGINDPFRMEIGEENESPLVKLIPKPEDSLIREGTPKYQYDRGEVTPGSGSND
jgi:hypothetical protein